MTFARLLRRPIAWLALGAVLCCVSPARAERVPLKTGETIVGRIVAERTNENILVIEDYISGGMREISWDAVVDAAVERIGPPYGRGGVSDVLVKGELIVWRLNTGQGEIRGVVEKTDAGFVYIRNISAKDAQKIAIADIVSREPIEIDPQDVWPIQELVDKKKAELDPQDARAWYGFAGYCEKIGAYQDAKDAYDTAATDEAYTQRDLAKQASARMSVLIADKSSLDELRDLRNALSSNLWKRVREAMDTFLTRHPEASDGVKKKVDDLKADFTKKRSAYFATLAGQQFEKIARRLIELRVRAKDAVFNDVQAWVRKDAITEAFDALTKQLQARDAAVTDEETKAFFDARPKKANGWRRVSYDSGSFLIEPAKIKPPSGQPKAPPGSSKKNNNNGPQVTIPIPKPPTRDTWWETASAEVRARFWWATFVEKNGLFEVQPKHDRTPCSTCDGAGKLTKLLSGGSSLEYLCPRCGGSQYDQLVVYR